METTSNPGIAGRVAAQMPGLSAERAEAARRAATAFEAQALSQMIQPMFAGIDATGGRFGGGQGEAMFRPMLLEAYAGKMARSGGVGIAGATLREMLRAQETSSARLDGGRP